MKIPSILLSLSVATCIADDWLQWRGHGGAIWVHPVIANGKLYLRDQEIISCYDVKASK